MSEKNEKFETKQNDSTPLQDYEIDVSNQNGFISLLLNKFKQRHQQKLLTDNTQQKTILTNISIASLWNFGNIRKHFINALDSISHTVSKAFIKSESTPNNTLVTEIIGSKTQTYVKTKDPMMNITIPKNKIISKLPANHLSKENPVNLNNIISANSKIEVGNIDTTAISDTVNSKAIDPPISSLIHPINNDNSELDR